MPARPTRSLRPILYHHQLQTVILKLQPRQGPRNCAMSTRLIYLNEPAVLIVIPGDLRRHSVCCNPLHDDLVAPARDASCPDDLDLLPYTRVIATGGLITLAWLNLSQLSTQTTPSFWFCVPFLALLLRDINDNTTGLGMMSWLAPYIFISLYLQAD